MLGNGISFFFLSYILLHRVHHRLNLLKVIIYIWLSFLRHMIVQPFVNLGNLAISSIGISEVFLVIELGRRLHEMIHIVNILA